MVTLSIYLMLILAQVKVTVKAPAQAETGQQVRVSYTVDTQDIDEYNCAEFQGFEVLFGPATSRQSSYSMVNGKPYATSSITFTYTVVPTKEGTFRLPVFTVTSGGKEYHSSQTSIQVLPGGSAPQADQSQATRMRTQSAGETITAKDLYFTVTASKHNVYEQEAILLTYKLYTLVNIDQCDGKIPELDGFHVQEIELPQQKTLRYERIDGKNYGTVVWKQYVLFPQQTGKLRVPAINFEAEVVQQDRTVNPFDAFFGGGTSLRRVKKTITAPAIEFDVKALPPGMPAAFSGAVGTGFQLSATLTPQQIDANDEATLRLVLCGTGNMKLMSPPTVEWPADFETYDPKTAEKTKLTTEGLTGNVTYEYTAVPRHGGRYAVPPIQFTYFDTKAQTYRTLRTDTLHLAVAKGTSPNLRNQAQQKEDVQELNSDIRHIKPSAQKRSGPSLIAYGTLPFWLSYVALIVLFVAGNIVANVVRKKRLQRRASRDAHHTAQKEKDAEQQILQNFMKRSLILTLFALPALTMAEPSTDSLYNAQQYEAAAKAYHRQEPTAEVCYNLGNCYYRTGHVARSILWYERASMLAPTDADLRHNLNLARQKTVDQITPRHQMFFVSWYWSIANLANANSWGIISLTLFALALLWLTLRASLRRTLALRASAACLCLSMLTLWFANTQSRRQNHRTGAIVMASSAVVKSTPATSGADLFIVHEGTRVEIRDTTLNQWREIELADGKRGWVPTQDIEAI